MSPENRKAIVALIAEAKTKHGVPVHQCLEYLGLDRNDYYKWKKDPDCVDHRLPEYRAKQVERKSESKNFRALSDEEVQQVIQHLEDSRYSHLSIANMHRMLQADGIHIASVSTYHRIAKEYGLTRKKRKAAARSSSNTERAKSDAVRMPLLATQALEVLVWDITEVETGIGKAYMYVCQDVYSKYVPLQRVYPTQSAENAVKFFTEVFTTYPLLKDTQMWLHSDNGGPMISRITKAILDAFNIKLSTSRALHSNDNAQMESYFKTFKKDMGADLTDCYSFEAMNAKAEMYRVRYNSTPHSTLNRVPPSIRFVSPTLERMFLDQCKEVHLKHFEEHPERYIQKKMTSYEPAGAQFLNPSYEMLIQVLLHNPNDKKALKYIERMEQHHLLDGVDRTLEKQLLAARGIKPDLATAVPEL